MGVIYCGSYAEQIRGHEGYAAQELPDGQLAATWIAANDGVAPWVAACECGWRGTKRHAPTDEGEEDAVEEWRRAHLDALIAAAAAKWPAWAESAACRARAAATDIAAVRHGRAVELLHGLLDDIASWSRIAEDLADEQR